MTAPLSSWPDDDPVVRHERGFRRELGGLLLALAGAVVLLWVLSTVDWRLPVGLAAAGALASGLYLGRGDTPADLEEG